MEGKMESLPDILSLNNEITQVINLFFVFPYTQKNMFSNPMFTEPEAF